MHKAAVVEFPKRPRHMPKGDVELAAEVHRAQRRLIRAVKAAYDAGLSLRMGKDIGDMIKVSRVFKR